MLQDLNPEAMEEVSNIKSGWWSSPWASAGCAIPSHLRNSAVGVRTFTNKECGGDVRVFYPAESTSSEIEAASWFSPSLAEMVDGYTHFIAGWVASLRKGTLAFEVVSFLMRSISATTSLKYAKLPNCYESLSARAGKAPLILWSHGLSGTGEEHGLLAARLATEGYVVAMMHHTDGSSSKVKTAEGKTIYFEHPDFKNYDVNTRQRGAEHRAKEVEAARQMLLNGEAGEDLKALCDADRVAVGGFSFGGATAALVASTCPQSYQCGVIFDGWFHIDIESRGISQDLPTQAFEKGFSLPMMFIGSEMFTTFKNIGDASKRIQKKCSAGHEAYTPLHSTHMSFCDVVWWIPGPLLTRFGFSEKARPYETYLEILERTVAFLKKHCPADPSLAQTKSS